MQLNVGGNSDFLNMLERERLESKKISKTNAVTSMLDYDLGAGNVHVGPSDYVPWLTDRKWAYIRMEGSSFGDVPLNVELKLEVWDSPNSAGIVIDAVRLSKLALNNGVAGSLVGPSSYLMKSPPKQIVDDEAYELTEEFIERERARRDAARGPGGGLATMTTQAVSARDWRHRSRSSSRSPRCWSARRGPSRSFPPLCLFVICGGLAATAAAGRRTYGARVSLVTAACTLPAAFVAFWLWWGIGVSSSLCGKDVSGGWTALACTVGALVFLAMGSFGLRTYRPWTIVPLAVVAAALSTLLVFVVAPGMPGFCET